MSIVEAALSRIRREEHKASPKPADSMIGKVAPSDLLKGEVPTGAPASPTKKILIDRTALRDAGYLPEATEDRAFADQYRQIKRPIIAAAWKAERDTPESPRLIMMASALPGDGKTFSCINLALSMARERDSSVVLVDGDTPKPHISTIFGAKGEPGLLDALANEAIDAESLILPTDVRGLSMLPAGRPHENASELLASERMRVIAARILARDPRRLVLFDSSPLLVSSESLALSGAVGQIIFVARAGKTPRQAVVDALAQLPETKLISFMLNQGRPSITQGYYYGQGSYGDNQARDD